MQNTLEDENIVTFSVRGQERYNEVAYNKTQLYQGNLVGPSSLHSHSLGP